MLQEHILLEQLVLEQLLLEHKGYNLREAANEALLWFQNGVVAGIESIYRWSQAVTEMRDLNI